jgi:hypothetical protein
MWGLAALVLTVSTDAAAQGRGRPKRPETPAAGRSGPPPSTSTAGSAAVAAPRTSSTTRFRQFGSWLDDASGLAVRNGTTGIGFGHWRADGGSQTDIPIVDVSYGLTNRVQFSATVPFYRLSYQGATAHGLDDVYLSGKIVAIDPETTAHRVGFAISPVLEILSTGFTDDHRLQWALPLSVEVRGDAVRAYASAGYFSRGAVFTGGAVEWTTPSGTALTVALTQSLSTSDVFFGSASAPGRQRVDLSGSVAHPLSDAVAGYVSIGRSLTSIADGGTSLALSAGFSISFAAATP